MKVMVTGAAGFVGAKLASEILRRREIGGTPVAALALLDREAPRVQDALATAIGGDLGGPAVLAQVAAFAPDLLFHLASMPGGAAEADYLQGRRVNLDATLALFEAAARNRGGERQRPPVVVFASTVAVYGTALPTVVTPATPLHPPLSYGAHKLVGEILLADFTRRGWLDGRSLRLPGIVARPRAPSGLASAFMSDMLHALKAGERYTCPVSPDATAWWMSAPRCVDNLLHAAAMDVAAADPARAWPMPVLRLSMAQVAQAAARLYGSDAGLVEWRPDERLEAVFGRYPELDDREARALGLRDDGDAQALVRRALA